MTQGFYGWKLLLALSSIVAVNLGVTFVGASVINASMAVGSGVGGLLSAPLMARIIVWMQGDWRAAWYFVLAAGLSAALVAILFVKNRPGDAGQQVDGDTVGVRERGAAEPSAAPLEPTRGTRERWTIREAVKTPALWFISLAAVGESASSTAALAHAVPHLRDLGHSAESAAAAMSVFAVCTIVGKLSVGFMCDRLEPRNAWSACILMMSVAICVATRAHSAGAMYLFTGMLGFGSGGALTCWHATVANYFGPAAFASILGAQMPFSNAVSAAAPFLVGIVYDLHGSYTPAFFAVAGFSAFAALMLLVTSAPTHGGGQPPPA